jgi:hypothetical protein
VTGAQLRSERGAGVRAVFAVSSVVTVGAAEFSVLAGSLDVVLLLGMVLVSVVDVDCAEGAAYESVDWATAAPMPASRAAAAARADNFF